MEVEARLGFVQNPRHGFTMVVVENINHLLSQRALRPLPGDVTVHSLSLTRVILTDRRRARPVSETTVSGLPGLLGV